MRILQLAKWLSPRADNGGKLRTYGLGLALSRFAEVDIVGFGDAAGQAALATAPRLGHYRRRYPVAMEGGWRRAAAVAADLARGQALRSSRFRSAAYRQQVAAALAAEAYDVVQVEEISTLRNLPPNTAPCPLVYSAHNVESALSPQLLRGRGGLLRALASLEARRTTAEERGVLARAGLCLAVSEEDARALERLDRSRAGRVHVVPNCVFDDVEPAPPRLRSSTEPAEIVTIGCFAWHPNAQGARWFIAEVLPLLRSQSRCVVRFVGSEIERPLVTELVAAGCEISADVDETLPYLHRARATFVPLLAGGGTRLKIVEAWAAGVPVVSTPLGAEGLAAVDGVDALLAADATSFAAALCRVIEDDDLCARLRDNGLRRAEAMRWTRQAPFLEDLYGALLARSRP